jgi:hypothetical protein
VVFGDLVLITLVPYLCWVALQQFRTALFAGGVRQPRLLRAPHVIRWSEITRVERHPLMLRLYAGEQRLTLNLVVFRDPAAVVEEITRRLPPGDQRHGDRL